MWLIIWRLIEIWAWSVGVRTVLLWNRVTIWMHWVASWWWSVRVTWWCIHWMHSLRWWTATLILWGNVLLRTTLWVLTWSHMRRRSTNIWWSTHWRRSSRSLHSHWRLSSSARRTSWCSVLLSTKGSHLLLLIHLLLRVTI